MICGKLGATCCSSPSRRLQLKVDGKQASSSMDALDELIWSGNVCLFMDYSENATDATRSENALNAYQSAYQMLEGMGLHESLDGAKVLMNIGVALDTDCTNGGWRDALMIYAKAYKILDQLGLEETVDGAKLRVSIGIALSHRDSQIIDYEPLYTDCLKEYTTARRILEGLGQLDTKYGAQLLENICSLHQCWADSIWVHDFKLQTCRNHVEEAHKALEAAIQTRVALGEDEEWVRYFRSGAVWDPNQPLNASCRPGYEEGLLDLTDHLIAFDDPRTGDVGDDIEILGE